MKRLTVFDTTGGNKEMHYTFKRDIFYDIEKFLNSSPIMILALIGPRQVGKTICLQQITECYDATYYDFKAITNSDETIEIFETIFDDIAEGKERIYILDEITNVDSFDTKLALLNEVLCKYVNKTVKIVMTGSQSTNLRLAADKVLGSKYRALHVPFLKFSEFCRMLGVEPSEDTFKDYVISAYSFSDSINDIEHYLNMCVAETISSNAKGLSFSHNYALNEQDTSVIYDLACSILYTLHKNMTRASLTSLANADEIRASYNLGNPGNRIAKKEFDVVLENSLMRKYSNINELTYKQFSGGIKFLYDCGLIIFIVRTNEDKSKLNYFLAGDPVFTNFTELLQTVNITFRYPMFYACFLKDIANQLDLDTKELLNNPMYGSLIECSVRSCLAERLNDTIQLEFNIDGKEVDYVSYSHNLAIEISTRDKKLNETHFEYFERLKTFDKFLLGKKKECYGDIRRVPYYKFIYDELKDMRFIGGRF